MHTRALLFARKHNEPMDAPAPAPLASGAGAGAGGARRRLPGWAAALIVLGALLAALGAALVALSELDRRRTRRSVAEHYKSNPALPLTALINYPLARASPRALRDAGPVIREVTPDLFPHATELRASWREIAAELRAARVRERAAPIRHDLFFRGIADDRWKRLYIKWYGPVDPEARRLLPRTCALLERMPEVHLAMISILEPGGRITPHSGPFAGCLRYHLGLETPNSDDCFIVVGGERYSWRDGEHVLFDDTFRHRVENNTDRPRTILFLDVERPQTSALARAWLRLLIHTLGPLTTRANARQETVARAA